MKRLSTTLMLVLVFIVLLATSSVMAAGGQNDAITFNPNNVHIVQLRDPSLAAYSGGIDGLAPTNPGMLGMRKLDVNSPDSQAYLAHLSQSHADLLNAISQRLGRAVNAISDYRYAFNGFALELSASEAQIVAALPQVKSVHRSVVRQPQTDHGPAWIGAPTLWGSPTGCTAGGKCGEGVIIGVLDTGINHDHASFADIGGDGYNHTNPFGAGVYKGYCKTTPSFCNDKLIGAYVYPTAGGPEDDEGHGSHTASTAGGNFVNNVNLIAPTITFPGLNISGVAPHANIIAYDVCGASGCYSFNTVNGIDQAVADGVDVINYSIGGASTDPWADDDAQAMLDARNAGVFVAVSAGNSGPGAATLGSPADSPWVTGVGAATHDRAFLNTVTGLTTDQSTTLPDLHGRSITSSYGPATIVYAGDAPYNNALCEAFPANTFSGQIVICDRGTNARLDKSANVKAAGGGGMILANDAPNGYGLNADGHSIPTVHISYADSVTLKNWLHNGNSGHKGRIVGSTMDVDDMYGDLVATFSSRGPNPSVGKVLKPDIVGPGVDIVAAVDTIGNPNPAPEIDSISGTSMSSPHLAGVGALLVHAHPTWTPAEIQSAIMSTAKVQDVLLDDGATPANPFERGAGRVDLTVASSAGFLLSETTANYTAANPGSGGNPANLNIASLAQDACAGSCTWTRTLKSTRAGNWQISFVTPAGLSMSASPAAFNFTAAGQTQTITFQANITGLGAGVWAFAQVNLEDGSNASPDAHFPVAVMSTCAAPAAPGNVTIAKVGVNAKLSWSSSGASSYEVWRSESPYFTPGAVNSTKITPDGFTDLTFTDTNALSNGKPNYYYKVMARSACGASSADTANHTATFSFILTPGNL